MPSFRCLQSTSVSEIYVSTPVLLSSVLTYSWQLDYDVFDALLFREETLTRHYFILGLRIGVRVWVRVRVGVRVWVRVRVRVRVRVSVVLWSE